MLILRGGGVIFSILLITGVILVVNNIVIIGCILLITSGFYEIVNVIKKIQRVQAQSRNTSTSTMAMNTSAIVQSVSDIATIRKQHVTVSGNTDLDSVKHAKEVLKELGYDMPETLPRIERQRRKEPIHKDYRSHHQYYLDYIDKHGGRSMPNDMLGTPLAYEYKDVPIILCDAPHILDDLMEWEWLNLRIEKPLPSDVKPVAVYLNRMENGKEIDGRLLGYMVDNPKRDMVRDYISKDKIMIAKLQRIDISSHEAYMHLAFYQKRNFSPRPVYRLVYNAGAVMQANISACKAGDAVTIECSKDNRWIASCNGLEIGYFPKNATYVVQDHPQSWIENIEKDGNGRQTVYVVCFAD